MQLYLDNAATSHPKPREVLAAVQEALTTLNANPGRSGHERALKAAECVLFAREAIAGLLGAEDPFRVIFCFNCTDALNLAIKGSLRPGDHVVASTLEHNSVLRVLTRLKNEGIIDLTLIPPQENGLIDPARYAMAVRHNTRLFVLTHASNVTGVVQPVRAVGRVARANGVRYLVDGAQTLGALNFRLSDIGCDLYAFPGHKSLLGPQGTGGLYIAPSLHLSTLREGGTGSSSESLLQPEELPERYEAGTLNLPGLAGLRAGVEYAKAHLNEIQAKEEALARLLSRELSAIGGVKVYCPPQDLPHTGTISFNVGDLSSGAVADQLNQRQICVRAGLHCAPLAHESLGTLKRGAVRASFGYANTEQDAERLIAAVFEIGKNAE